ncbi:MAG: hypothetical protein AAGF46_09580, partial [Pseudomonadota bacterium]
NTGRDANGTPVTMDFAIAKSIRIGTATFLDVPVLIHDFADVPLAHCYLPYGLLGSELLPGSVWRINTTEATISIAPSIEALPKLVDTHSAPLELYGYPHAPIIPYAIGEFSDRALFDTGNSGALALFQRIADDERVGPFIDKKTLQTGRGTHGVSAGGIGDVMPITRFELTRFSLGAHATGRIRTQLRPVPPTLVGAGFLASHVITLDYPNARFMMSRLAEETVPLKANNDFGLMLIDDRVEVAQLMDDSRASKSGLALGDTVVAINGREVFTATAEAQCATALWLSNEFKSEDVKTITVQREDDVSTFTLAAE